MLASCPVAGCLAYAGLPFALVALFWLVPETAHNTLRTDPLLQEPQRRHLRCCGHEKLESPFINDRQGTTAEPAHSAAHFPLNPLRAYQSLAFCFETHRRIARLVHAGCGLCQFWQQLGGTLALSCTYFNAKLGQCARGPDACAHI